MSYINMSPPTKALRISQKEDVVRGENFSAMMCFSCQEPCTSNNLTMCIVAQLSCDCCAVIRQRRSLSSAVLVFFLYSHRPLSIVPLRATTICNRPRPSHSTAPSGGTCSHDAQASCGRGRRDAPYQRFMGHSSWTLDLFRTTTEVVTSGTHQTRGVPAHALLAVAPMAVF